jgi:predicted transcriptional regulator
MTHPVHVCRSEDDVTVALDMMAKFKVRRLPVLDASGNVKGLISIDDIILWGVPGSAVTLHDLLAALRSLCVASTYVASERAVL